MSNKPTTLREFEECFDRQLVRGMFRTEKQQEALETFKSFIDEWFTSHNTELISKIERVNLNQSPVDIVEEIISIINQEKYEKTKERDVLLDKGE